MGRLEWTYNAGSDHVVYKGSSVPHDGDPHDIPPAAAAGGDSCPRIFFRLIDTRVSGKFVKIAPASGVSRLSQRDLVVAVLDRVEGADEAPVVSVQPTLHEARTYGARASQHRIRFRC